MGIKSRYTLGGLSKRQIVFVTVFWVNLSPNRFFDSIMKLSFAFHIKMRATALVLCNHGYHGNGGEKPTQYYVVIVAVLQFLLHDGAWCLTHLSPIHRRTVLCPHKGLARTSFQHSTALDAILLLRVKKRLKRTHSV